MEPAHQQTEPLAANDNHPSLGKVYDLDEAAAYLKIDKRTVAKVARREGLCTIINREYRFIERDLLAIWEAMRCHSNLSAGVKYGTSPAQSADKLSEKLRELTKKKSRKRSLQ